MYYESGKYVIFVPWFKLDFDFLYFRRSRRQDVKHGDPLRQCRGFNAKGTVMNSFSTPFFYESPSLHGLLLPGLSKISVTGMYICVMVLYMFCHYTILPLYYIAFELSSMVIIKLYNKV